MTAKLKPTKTKVVDIHARNLPLTLKLSIRERAMYDTWALKFTDGNISELIRFAVNEFIERRLK